MQAQSTSGEDSLLLGSTRERIPIRFLGASPWQPRQHFDEAELQQLAESIQANGGNWTDCLVWRVSGSYIVDHTAKGDGKKLPEYFVLAGERRLRACQLGLKQKFAACGSLWCRVMSGSLKDAERLARLENLHRKDLSAIEQVRNLKAMLESGQWRTQAELAKEVGLTPAALSNQLRVLELPNEWLDLVSQEKLTLTHLRSLAAWIEHPRVLATAKLRIIDEPDDSVFDYDVGFGPNERLPTVKEFDEAVLDAVKEASRPVEGRDVWERHFDLAGKPMTITTSDLPTPAMIKRDNGTLQVIDVPGLGRRAFNLDVWNSLSQHAKAARAKKSGTAGSESSKGVDGKDSIPMPTKLSAAEQREAAKQKAQQFAKRLYRYRLTWLRRRIIDEIARASAPTLMAHILAFAATDGHGGLSHRHHEFGDAVIACGGTQKSGRHGYAKATDVWASLATLAKRGEGVDLIGLARAALSAWYQHDFDSSSTDTTPEFLEGSANHLGIDFTTQWTLDREFLELHSKEQLFALTQEWQLEPVADVFQKTKRDEAIDAILEVFSLKQKPAPLPKCLKNLKPVSLL